jgi:hypothetical protein
LPRVAAAYLALQGVATLLWWGTLILVPASRRSFVAAGAPLSTLWAFVGADALFLAGASLAAAWGLTVGRRWGWPVLCAQAGASIYASLYCLTLWRLDPSTWVGAVLMLPVLVIPPTLAWLLRPRRLQP